VTDFESVHGRLREIILRHSGDLAVTKDGPGGMAVEIPGLEGKPWGYVAGTRVGKSYVSYYLMPVYAIPSLRDGLSPALAKRMQGKACFNFTRIDENILAELSEVTGHAIATYRDQAIAERNAAEHGSRQKSR
jgi:hypothetical protein